MDDNLEYFAIYSANCLKCGHLVEADYRKYDKCHYSNGNKQCPASEVRVTITGKVERLVKRLIKARKRKDPQREAEVLTLVSKESPSFQRRFYQELAVAQES